MLPHCLSRPGAWPAWPWGRADPEAGDGPDGHVHPVVKVGPPERAKIFAFVHVDRVGVKGGPSREAADEWLERYPADATVMAYIGRSGWNDLALQGGIPDEELREAVDESYRLVVSRLPQKLRPDGWEE